MINTRTNYVEAFTIGDAWREVMLLCVKNGKDFVVKGGSYVGQIRKQLPLVTINILEPGTRPLAPILPPTGKPPTSEEKIEAYFERYILGDRVEENEQYTYGQYIMAQINQIVRLLRDSEGNTNQACITIGDISTTFLSDPPCLRLVSFKVVEGKLVMTVFFRSWDLYTGLPENLGGLQLLKEHVLTYLEDLGITDGPIIGQSDGLHIYSQYFDIVDELNIDKIEVAPGVWADKLAWDEEHGR